MRTPGLVTLWQRWQGFVADKPYPAPPPYAGPDLPFTRFVEDSRLVESGDWFVARVRPYSDGHPYIAQAMARGAALILAQRSAESLALNLPPSVVYWQVPDTAEALAWLSAALYEFPGQHLTTIGVTGTDGKTSTVNMLYHILAAAGFRTGMISTIKAVIGDEVEPLGLHVTTPQAPEVQAYLRRMVEAGVTHCVLEATSMGLAEQRVATAFFQVGVITNITHEHLDYHGDYSRYLADKARLLALASQTAILNRDDASYPLLLDRPMARRLTYALDDVASADVWAADIAFAPDATRFNLHTRLTGQPRSVIPIHTPLLGRFNVYNMLAAAAAALSLDVDLSAVQTGLQAVRTISGRMERIDRGQPFLVVVDFAHTPNALLRAIEAARSMTTGRIIAVFGSAGRRDVEKRRMMAEVSAEYADQTILTAEDPRNEPLTDILAFMAEGCRRFGGMEGQTFWRVPDRGRAIYHALTLARPDDLVLICGKGHEQSMCFGAIEYPWDDRQATCAALDAFLQGAPMVDTGLPTFAEGGGPSADT